MNEERPDDGLDSTPAVPDTPAEPPVAHSPGGPPPGPPGAPPQGPDGRPGLPWERPDGRTISGAIETIRLILIEPGEGFAMMRRSGSLADPLLFLILFGTIGAFFGLLWQSTLRTFWGTMADADFAQIAAINSVGMVSLLMAPVFALLFTAVMSILVHLGLMAFGGANYPLDTTLRTVAYASGATHLIMIIPFCGGIVGAIWWVVALSIGVREAQGVPGGRAVVAVLAPFVLVCCCCMALGMTFGAAISTLAGG